MVGLTLIQLPAAGVDALPASAAAADAVPGAAAAGGSEADPLNTVGLALLAYGLVQLLSKVIDKLPVFKAGGGEHAASSSSAGGFGADDRKRLERVLEQVVADHQRLERLEALLRDVAEGTRWMAEMRARDPRDGEPVWACRARALADPLAVNQRLTGQALDELRTANARLDNILRKLRALWVRIGRRKKDRG
ncbi:MAG TPA: hypothetical protein VFR81_25310 [Longimicrobium sp.]|nr:hypothetical protein [Longimicrobium sp.]